MAQKGDKNSMNFAKKAMIQCGMSLGLDGTWSETQLTQKPSELIPKHRQYFEGQPVNPADVEIEYDSEYYNL